MCIGNESRKKFTGIIGKESKLELNKVSKRI